jgi:hypothetical protein
MDMDLIAEKRELGSRRGTESGSCKAQSELRGGEQEGGDAQASRQARFESRSMLIDWSDEIQEQQPTTILARVPSANGHISEIMPCEDASKSGANANANKRRTEPLTLHEAAREGELKALELALEKGAMTMEAFARVLAEKQGYLEAARRARALEVEEWRRRAEAYVLETYGQPIRNPLNELVGYGDRIEVLQRTHLRKLY